MMERGTVTRNGTEYRAGSDKPAQEGGEAVIPPLRRQTGDPCVECLSSKLEIVVSDKPEPKRPI